MGIAQPPLRVRGPEKPVMRCTTTDKGARVRFRISDVFLPSPEELLSSAETETEGAIVDFSDSGSRRHAFAVVEAENGQTLVIPVEKLRPAKTQPSEKRR